MSLAQTRLTLWISSLQLEAVLAVRKASMCHEASNVAARWNHCAVRFATKVPWVPCCETCKTCRGRILGVFLGMLFVGLAFSLSPRRDVGCVCSLVACAATQAEPESSGLVR